MSDLLKELPIELRNSIPPPPDVFLFVNPLTGNHAKTRADGKLAVFINASAAYSWEKNSESLKNKVGYTCSWDEMIQIANQETQGQYEYFTTCS